MTEKKIIYALSRIKQAKENKYPLEALLRAYHLNIELIKLIILKASPKYDFKGKKVKELLNACQNEVNTKSELRSIITKRSIKSCKAWLLKMDSFFKSLKLHPPTNYSLLQSETEKICGILKLSSTKLLLKK